MIYHICDYCGKIIKDNGVICSIPYYKKLQIENYYKKILGPYDAGKVDVLKGVELCINCATTLVGLFESECNEFSKKEK